MMVAGPLAEKIEEEAYEKRCQEIKKHIESQKWLLNIAKETKTFEKLSDDAKEFLELGSDDEKGFDYWWEMLPFEESEYEIYYGTLDDFIQENKTTFSTTLLSFMKEKNLTSSNLYENNNFDRRQYSKILNYDENHNPSKRTVLHLAILMQLNIDETTTLLESAGYTFSNTIFENVIKYFIMSGIYDLIEINTELVKRNQTPLGIEKY